MNTSVMPASARCTFYMTASLLLLLASGQLMAVGPQETTQDTSAKKSQYIWLDAEGKPLPFKNDREIKEFLVSGKVIGTEEIPEGITDPKRVLLEKDGIRAHAVFRFVNISRPQGPAPGGRTRLNFRDQCVYECAAYELDRLIGLGRVPPATERKLKGNSGTIQIWVENTMTEKDRVKKELPPPNKWKWMMQNQIMRLFDCLVYNDDRNQGNILIDKSWNLILIDHTRAFRTLDDLPQIESVQFCERKVWEGLKNLDEKVVQERLKAYLKSNEIAAIMQRRDKIVDYIQRLIDEKGERGVLFNMY